MYVRKGKLCLSFKDRTYTLTVFGLRRRGVSVLCILYCIKFNEMLYSERKSRLINCERICTNCCLISQMYRWRIYEVMYMRDAICTVRSALASMPIYFYSFSFLSASFCHLFIHCRSIFKFVELFFWLSAWLHNRYTSCNLPKNQSVPLPTCVAVILLLHVRLTRRKIIMLGSYTYILQRFCKTPRDLK